MSQQDVRMDDAAGRLEQLLPPSDRIVAIGSASFWETDSERYCRAIGWVLATCLNTALITGGVAGVGDTIGRAFFDARVDRGAEPGVYHLLPHGFAPADYGVTFPAGQTMAERREILGRVRGRFIVVEGGPGTSHEASVALAFGSMILPVGRSGGAAGELFSRLTCLASPRHEAWAALGSSDSSPEDVVAALLELVSDTPASL